MHTGRPQRARVASANPANFKSIRNCSQFHKAGTEDGWHGTIKEGSSFPPEMDRYHMYIGLFCPFSQIANIVRYTSNLTEAIPASVCKPFPKGQEGFRFPDSANEVEGSTLDKVFGLKYMSEIYFKSDTEYKGRWSVPVLLDIKTGTIVNNESAELLRWLPLAFSKQAAGGSAQTDLYPESHRATIDAITPWMTKHINQGVYRAGRAPDQEKHEQAVIDFYAALNKLEELVNINGGPFILGETMTELDVRAFVTLIRFDVVYTHLFKLNLGTLRHDYPTMENWMRGMYWNVEGFKETTNFVHIKLGYYKCFTEIDPVGLVPMGPMPNIRQGFEADFTKVPCGGVRVAEVLERQATIDKIE